MNTRTPTPELTIFFDATCPLCQIEMDRLSERNQQQRIAFENIYASDFGDRYPHINIAEADRILHGQLRDGTMLLGLDVTHKAWSLVDRGYLTGWLRWPLVRTITDCAYRLFARNRYQISFWLTGNKRYNTCHDTLSEFEHSECNSGQCQKLQHKHQQRQSLKSGH